MRPNRIRLQPYIRTFAAACAAPEAPPPAGESCLRLAVRERPQHSATPTRAGKFINYRQLQRATAVRTFAATTQGRKGDKIMLHYAVVFLDIALIAGVLGFFGLAG